jgi:ribosomal protein S27E
MGRRDLSKIKPLVQRHNRILREHAFTLRQRRKMINNFNHVRVSLNTLYRWDLDDLKNRTEPTKESNILEWRCSACNGTLLFDHEKEELACNACGLVAERVRRVRVDNGTQREQFQPTLFSSFNKGLGSAQPEPLICWIIKHAGNNRKISSYEVRGELFQLRKHISSEDDDAKLNKILQHLTRRIQEIKGFDPSSDKNSQFITLDELGRFLSRARQCLRSHRFSPTKLVDALLIHAFGEDARQIIEAPLKHLKCPRCREETAYAPDKSNEFILCVECGKAIRVEEAKFKVTYRPIEQKYHKTIERLLATIPTPLETQRDQTETLLQNEAS